MGNMTRRGLMVAGAFLPLGGLAAAALAQGRVARPASLDPSLAAKLLMTGRKQINLCEMALDRTRNDDVAEFAEDEIREHEFVRSSLEDLGYQYPRVVQEQVGLPMIDVTVGRGTIPSGAAQMLTIEQEVKNQCIQTARSEYNRLRGSEFDQRFMNQQLDAHYDLFDHAVVFRNHASRELAPLLDESRPLIERHIRRCKDIIASLDPTMQANRSQRRSG